MKIQKKLILSIFSMLFVCLSFSQSKKKAKIGQDVFPENEKVQFMLQYLATGAYGGQIKKVSSYFVKNISPYADPIIHRYDNSGKKRKNLSSIYGRDQDKVSYRLNLAKGELLVFSYAAYVFDLDNVTQRENLLIGYGRYHNKFIYTYEGTNYLITNSPGLNGGFCTEIKSNRATDNYISSHKAAFLREIAAHELSDDKITLANEIKSTIEKYPHTIYKHEAFSQIHKVGDFYVIDNILYKGDVINEKPHGYGYISFLSDELTIEEIGKKIAYIEATKVYFNNGNLISIGGKEVENDISYNIKEIHYSQGGIVSLYIEDRPEKIIIDNTHLVEGKANPIVFKSKKNNWTATATLNERFEIMNPTIKMHIRQVDCHLKVGEFYTMNGRLDGKRNIIADKNKRVLLQGKNIKYYSNSDSYGIGDWVITNNDNVCQNGTHTEYYKDGKTKQTEYSYTDWGVCLEHSSRESKSNYTYQPPILFSDDTKRKMNDIFAGSGASSTGEAVRCSSCSGMGRHYEYETVEDCEVVFDETEAGIWRKKNCKNIQRVKNIRRCSRCKGKGVINK